MSKAFAELDERELLALAISLEEEDSRIYRHFRERLKEKHPEAAAIIQSMYEEEISHQARLTELYHQTFGDHVLFIRTHDVKGFLKRRPIWLRPLLRPKKVLAEVMRMEAQARWFYTEAVNQVTSPATQKLFRDLAEEEENHQDLLVEKWKEKKKSTTSL
jgi:rubrerythrin